MGYQLKAGGSSTDAIHLTSVQCSPTPRSSYFRSSYFAAYLVAVLFAATLLGGCNNQAVDSNSTTSPSSPVSADDGAVALSNTKATGETAPLLDGIGPLHMPISTDVPMAQKYFDQALTLAFGFNHAESVRSFREAARQDPTCGICYWGVALALGPNINAPMAPEAIPEAWAAVQQALALRDLETPLEQAYIDAISTRYSKEGGDRAALDLVYAGAMQRLVERFPQDHTARTLMAEAYMDVTPWAYWNDDASPGPYTETFVAALEKVIAEQPDHPGALHLYIHAMEQFSPAKAEAVADRLGPLVPVAGHLVHMPSHIYLRLGRYHDAVIANTKAAESDEDYIAQCNAQGLYPASYYPHNIHFLWYSAMMEGRRELALASAHKLRDRVPLEMAKMMGAVQQFLAVPSYTYVRFGLWDKALAEAPPPADLPLAQAMWHYAHGMAYASTDRLKEAQKSLAQLQLLQSNGTLDALVVRQGHPVAPTLLNIATHLVTARIAQSQGENAVELAQLTLAVAAQDSLPYTEPPFWHFPVRQALAAAQLRQGDAVAAAATYRADLVKFPRNGWSLYGLLQAQPQALDQAELTAELETAWKYSDIEPTAGY